MIPVPLQTTVEQAISGCSWGAWWHLPAGFIATIGAVLAHELTHAVVMYPVAEEVRVEWDSVWLGELHVESDILNDTIDNPLDHLPGQPRAIRWRHVWADIAGIAPALIGVGVLAYWWATGWPATDVLGIAQYNALLWYSFLGGLTDYSRSASLKAAESDEEAVPPGVAALPDGGQKFVSDQQRLINVALLASVSALLGFLYQGTCSGLVSTTGAALGNLGVLLFVGAIGVLFIRLEQHSESAS